MKTKIAISLILFFFNTMLFAQRELDRTEVLNIFSQLTANPRNTWIPAGTIIAEHEEIKSAITTDSNEIAFETKKALEEYANTTNKKLKDPALQKMRLDAIPFNIKYKLSNDSTMKTKNVMKFTGDKFYREISVLSRNDSVTPGKDLESNFLTDNFRVEWNQKRIFAWDGTKFIMYTPSMESAIIDEAGSMPTNLGGEAKIGLIPWGYGYYTYENLASMQCIATEETVDGQVQVTLVFSSFDNTGNEVILTLLPDKDYAISSCVTNKLNGTTVSKIYSDYVNYDGFWVPQLMVFEKFDDYQNKLISKDTWQFVSVDINVLSEDSFRVNFLPETSVERFTSVTPRGQKYIESGYTNSEHLFADRMEYLADQGNNQQNCATAAMKLVMRQYGKTIDDLNLSNIVDINGNSSLLDLKQLAQNNGLYAKAIKTDISGLQNLRGCEIILYLPGKRHFVLLEKADSQYVRLIDITKDKFNYKVDTNFFGMDWPGE